MAGGGLAVGLLPMWASWRTPFIAAAIVAAVGVVVVMLAPHDSVRHAPAAARATVRDPRLLPLGAWHAASFGLSVVLGNWVATLLQRGGHESAHVAGLVGGLVLFLGVVSRPAGGRLLERPRVVQASFVVGGFAIGLLSIARPLPLAIAAAAVVGLAAGVPFASAFAGAQRIRPDAPAAAVGVVNLAATIVILVGTPLVGLSFSLPGDGRIGFLVCGFLFASAALAVRARR
jgi:nitrate/nitrite transporter NarK